MLSTSCVVWQDMYATYRHLHLLSVSHLRQAFVKVAKANAVFKHWKDFAKGLGVPDQEIKKIEEQGGSGQVI